MTSITLVLYSFHIHSDSKVHGAHLGPVGPMWALCWSHGPCYQGREKWGDSSEAGSVRTNCNILYGFRNTLAMFVHVLIYCTVIQQPQELSAIRCSAVHMDSVAGCTQYVWNINPGYAHCMSICCTDEEVNDIIIPYCIQACEAQVLLPSVVTTRYLPISYA